MGKQRQSLESEISDQTPAYLVYTSIKVKAAKVDLFLSQPIHL